MEERNVYQDISRRTDGDVYIGVVGPVRTGKSTFIKLLLTPLPGSAPESRQFSGHRHFRQSQRQQETEWNLMQLQEFTSAEQAQPAESLLLQAR